MLKARQGDEIGRISRAIVYFGHIFKNYRNAYPNVFCYFLLRRFVKILITKLCIGLYSGASPTIATSYNAKGSLARFENKNIFFDLEKRYSPHTTTLAL
jgi:hypothetical protein